MSGSTSPTADVVAHLTALMRLNSLIDTSRYPGAMPISTGFNHVATLSTDLDRHAEWWGRVFGAVVTFKMDKQADHPRMFILDVGGGAALNVFEVSEDEIIGERRRQGGRGAIDHFAIAVDSLDDARGGQAATGRRRRRHRGDPALGSEWSLFFRDIDGMELEVCAVAD